MQHRAESGIDACMPRLYIAHGPLRDKYDSRHGWTQINTDGEKMKEFGAGGMNAAAWHALPPGIKSALSRRGVYLIASIAIVCACAFLGADVSTRAAPQAAQRTGQTLTGIDALEAEHFAPLAGKRIGLITNQTGTDRNRRSTI